MPKQKTTTIEDVQSLIKELPKEEFYKDGKQLKHYIDGISSDYNGEYYNGLSKKMTDIYDSERKRYRFINTVNTSGSNHDNISGLRTELYNLNIEGLFRPEIKKVSKDEKLNDAFDDLFNGVDSDKLNLTHLDIPEVWKLVEPYYNKFIQIYNDICSFNRMNYIENDECLRITWETINGDTNQTMTYETPIDSVRGRLNATEFIYNIGGFNQPNSVKLDIVYKST